jgi:hypothetical protein
MYLLCLILSALLYVVDTFIIWELGQNGRKIWDPSTRKIRAKKRGNRLFTLDTSWGESSGCVWFGGMVFAYNGIVTLHVSTATHCLVSTLTY